MSGEHPFRPRITRAPADPPHRKRWLWVACPLLAAGLAWGALVSLQRSDRAPARATEPRLPEWHIDQRTDEIGKPQANTASARRLEAVLAGNRAEDKLEIPELSFEPGSANLLPDGAAAARDLGQVLAARAGDRVRIVGKAGDEALAGQRAETIAAIFMDVGVAASRIAIATEITDPAATAADLAILR